VESVYSDGLCFAMVASKTNGFASIKAGSMGCENPYEIKVHYLIISPAP